MIAKFGRAPKNLKPSPRSRNGYVHFCLRLGMGEVVEQRRDPLPRYQIIRVLPFPRSFPWAHPESGARLDARPSREPPFGSRTRSGEPLFHWHGDPLQRPKAPPMGSRCRGFGALLPQIGGTLHMVAWLIGVQRS